MNQRPTTSATPQPRNPSRAARTLAPAALSALRALKEDTDDALAAVLRAGADPNETDGDRFPLRAAAALNRTGAIRLLLAAGADVNMHRKRDTALHEAAASGSLDAAQLLIDAGARLDLRDGLGLTALLLACKRPGDSDCGEIAMALVRAGAPVRCRDEDGKTPLLLALEYNNARLVDALLRAGSRWRDVDEDGRSALVFAIELAEHRHAASTAGFAATPEFEPLGLRALLAFLLRKEGGVARARGRAAARKWLTRADPIDELSALGRAALRGQWATCALLLDAGVEDRNAVAQSGHRLNSAGRTPREFAKKRARDAFAAFDAEVEAVELAASIGMPRARRPLSQAPLNIA
ncbi:ankyrin repeat protein [Paraburkholderia fungorum]|jgi:ankyrin repeat protein|uniref:ankyrin repeat domain-containing protein n=1 Tax=Paraburkholderia fungorum TaxID=134537 RepID=UPI000D0798AE|nr:ankyrin repeat domain-containing protein [Paraburkholderia fungorum]PRZ56481.1 ankyrin repeat protein [Paraburkholderia fungorum]